jgi:hypothetical protein
MDRWRANDARRVHGDDAIVAVGGDDGFIRIASIGNRQRRRRKQRPRAEARRIAGIKQHRVTI